MSVDDTTDTIQRTITSNTSQTAQVATTSAMSRPNANVQGHSQAHTQEGRLYMSSPPPNHSAHSLSMTTTTSPMTNYPIGTPFPGRRIVIRHLPGDTTKEDLRLILLFSKELVNIDVLPPDQCSEPGFCDAIVKFRTAEGAQQAKEMLHGKSPGSSDVELVVDIMDESLQRSSRNPYTTSVSNQGAGYLHDTTVSGRTNGHVPVASSGISQRQASRMNDPYQSVGRTTSPSSGPFGNNELRDPEYRESSMPVQSLFTSQSPIGNHLANRTHISGRSLILESAEDEEAQELLNNTVAYADNGATHHDVATQQRRATAPQLYYQNGSLSLNTNTNGIVPQSSYARSGMAPQSAHANSMSPTMMNGAGYSLNFTPGASFNNRNPHMPPANPADQNPPCNTLYVGNLPLETSEEELKSMFSKQRGYRRLCLRTKQNGPMCFVEFESITTATKALSDLYGQMLHNSNKGGIRLSFSKNPLGVRSPPTAGSSSNGPMASMNGLMVTTTNGYAGANGPPPGLAAPPGLNRANVWGPPTFNGHMNGGGPSSTPSGALTGGGSSSAPSAPNGHASGFFPPYMNGHVNGHMDGHMDGR